MLLLFFLFSRTNQQHPTSRNPKLVLPSMKKRWEFLHTYKICLKTIFLVSQIHTKNMNSNFTALNAASGVESCLHMMGKRTKAVIILTII